MACNTRKPRKLPTKLEIPTKRPRGFMILCAALLVILFGRLGQRIWIVGHTPRYRDVTVVAPELVVTPVVSRMEGRIAYHARRAKDRQDKPIWREVVKAWLAQKMSDESKALWNRPGSEALKDWLGVDEPVIGVGPARGPPARGARPRLHLP